MMVNGSHILPLWIPNKIYQLLSKATKIKRMLAEIKFKTFQELVKSASREELVWMNGFLSALLLGEAPVTQEASSAENSGNSPLNGCSVVYGTETGNSKKVATDFG